MISLAGRDILHSWSKFVYTGLGLGLLIGVTFTMAGVYRGILGMPGVAQAANVTYLTMQVRKNSTDVRAMIVGFVPGEPGEPGYLIARRRVTRSHYEAVVDVNAGFEASNVGLGVSVLSAA